MKLVQLNQIHTHTYYDVRKIFFRDSTTQRNDKDNAWTPTHVLQLQLNGNTLPYVVMQINGTCLFLAP